MTGRGGSISHGEIQRGNDTAREKTNLVNALKGHWYNDMLKTVARIARNKVEEGDQPKSHETDISACEGFLKRREGGRDIVSD